MTKKASNFFDKFKDDLVAGLNTIAIGQIVAFDPVKMKADIKVLPEKILLVDVPVGTLQTKDFFIRLPFQKGDFVVVAFAQRDIDGIIYSDNAKPSQRMLSLDDAVVICGLNIFVDSLPGVDPDKLVIGQKDGAAKITMGGGKISLIGDVDVNGVALQSGGGNF